MKFSIVIPLYNKQKSVRRAIVSALDQQGIDQRELEILVVNDGSLDGSAMVVEAVREEFVDKRIKLISQSNAGVSAARNRGIAESSGQYICFLDSDDTYRPNFLEEISKLIEMFPESLIFGTSYAFVYGRQGKIKDARTAKASSLATRRLIDNFFWEAATSDLPFCASSFCAPKYVFTELGGFPEGENMGEDQDFYIRAALHGTIAHSKRVCANYYIDVDHSLMDSVSPDKEMPYSKRLQARLDNGQVPEKFVEGAKLLVAGHLTDLARRNLATKSVQTAKRFLIDRRSRKSLFKWLYWSLKAKFAELRY